LRRQCADHGRGRSTAIADIRPLGTECGEQAWPYFVAARSRDARRPLAEPRDVRTIAAERVFGSDPFIPAKALTKFLVKDCSTRFPHLRE